MALGGSAFLAAGAVLILFACTAAAEDFQSQQSGDAPLPTTTPRPANEPSFLATFGRWVDDSLTSVTTGFNSARKTVGSVTDQATSAAKETAGVAKDAAGAVVRFPVASLVSGHQHCVRAANGGPDCVAATEVLCRAKGYNTGTSLHIQSEQKCPVWGWISGEKPAGKCTTETYVTRAMCQ